MSLDMITLKVTFIRPKKFIPTMDFHLHIFLVPCLLLVINPWMRSRGLPVPDTLQWMLMVALRSGCLTVASMDSKSKRYEGVLEFLEDRCTSFAVAMPQIAQYKNNTLAAPQATH
jgi:hypothetical protein